MSEAKPPYLQLAYGLFFLFLGILFEAFGRPVQPITYVPGLALVPFGVGIGLALLERKWKTPSYVAMYLVMFIVLIYEGRAATSILPFCLLVAAHGLTRFLLFFYRE